jgi:hypothetical protein
MHEGTLGLLMTGTLLAEVLDMALAPISGQILGRLALSILVLAMAMAMALACATVGLPKLSLFRPGDDAIRCRYRKCGCFDECSGTSHGKQPPYTTNESLSCYLFLRYGL